LLVDGVTTQIRRLPNWVEASLVLGIIFGWQIYGALTMATPDTGAPPIQFNDVETVWLLRWEVFLMVIVGAFLQLRGWKEEDLPMRVSVATTKEAFKLWFLTLGVYYTFSIVLMQIPAMAASAKNAVFRVDVSWWAIILLCAINPLFEEVITVGYLVRRMEGFHPAVVALTSAGLRSIVHTYQGGFWMTMMLPFGLVFVWHFQRKRQLWPLIVAHAIFDFVGMVTSPDND
jgi:membrane protease YdiL (CAAX protease family)